MRQFTNSLRCRVWRFLRLYERRGVGFQHKLARAHLNTLRGRDGGSFLLCVLRSASSAASENNATQHAKKVPLSCLSFTSTSTHH